MKHELKAVEAKYNELEISYKAKLQEKEKQIAELKEGVKLAKLVEEYPACLRAAEAAGLSLEDWVLDVIEKIQNPNVPVIPIPKEFYSRICRIAEMRGMNLTRFMHSEDVRTRLEIALDNLVY